MRANDTQNKPISVGQRTAGISYTVTMVTIVAIALVFSFVSAVLGENFIGSVAYQCMNYGLGGVAVLLAFIISLTATKTPFKSVAKFKVEFKYVALALLIFLGMYFGLGNLNVWLVNGLQKIGYSPDFADDSFFTPKTFLFLTVFVAIAPAVFEELVFRGLILNGLKEVGQVKAVFISAFAFSLYHMSIEKTVYQFLAGLIFALIALKSRSLLPTVLIHFLNNFVVILNYCFFKVTFDSARYLIVSTVLGILCLVAAVVILTFSGGKNSGGQRKKTSSKYWWFYSIIGLLVAFSLWIGNLVA